MKVDYGEIIFQSTEGITEDQGLVQLLNSVISLSIMRYTEPYSSVVTPLIG